MSREWRSAGSGGLGEALWQIATLGYGVRTEYVENLESGEIRAVAVGPYETVGEAMANGQFIDKE